MSNEMTIQSSTFGIADPAAIAAAERVKAIVLAKFMMAVQRPRDMMEAREKILETCKRREFAEKAEYAVPVWNSREKKNDFIIGPSIRLAEVIIQKVGNIDVSTSVVFEDEKTRRVRVEVTDLETNTTYSDETSISKTVERRRTKDTDTILGKRTTSTGETVYIIAATDADLAKKENAVKSKIIRNHGLRLVPEDIVKEAVKVCRATMSGGKDVSLVDRRKALVDKFRTVGVTTEMLVEYTRKAIDQLIETDLADLLPIYNALKDGHSTWADFMPERSENENAKPTTAEAAKEAIKKRTQKKQEPTPEPETFDVEPEEVSLFEQAKRRIENAKTMDDLNAAHAWYFPLCTGGTGEIVADEENDLTAMYLERKKQITGRGV